MKTQGFILWNIKYEDQNDRKLTGLVKICFYLFTTNKLKIKKKRMKAFLLKIQESVLGRKAEFQTEDWRKPLCLQPHLIFEGTAIYTTLLDFKIPACPHTISQIKPRRKWHILKPFSKASFPDNTQVRTIKLMSF